MSDYAMSSSPLILISPCTEQAGTEFADLSLSLSNRYNEAILAAGGLPVTMPATTSETVVGDLVRRCDGVLLSGGGDIESKYYAKELPDRLAATIKGVEPERDVWELMVIKEVFRQRKPLLAICRGIQMLNVAMGGDLIVDIPTQLPGAIDHRRMDKKMEPVHEVRLTSGSLVARITGENTLGVNSTHHQAVGRLADGLEVTGRSTIDGVVEVVELKDPARLPFLVGVQFHPERMISRNKAFLSLFSSFVDSCVRENRK